MYLLGCVHPLLDEALLMKKEEEEKKKNKYTNLMWANESVNKMTNKSSIASTLAVQMYRVNKNNEKRCTLTSDENHFASKQATF